VGGAATWGMARVAGEVAGVSDAVRCCQIFKLERQLGWWGVGAVASGGVEQSDAATGEGVGGEGDRSIKGSFWMTEAEKAVAQRAPSSLWPPVMHWAAFASEKGSSQLSHVEGWGQEVPANAAC